MKHIEKQMDNEPDDLKVFKTSTHGASFKSLHSKTKRALKNALLQEQGYLCAYCMRQIDQTNTSIEHFLPQSKFPDLSLNYANLLAVCDGNQGHGKHLLQCDKKKSNKLLTKIDPRKPEIEQQLYYSINGKIKSDDQEIELDLLQRLNLNNQRIVENRQVVIDAVIEFVQAFDNKTVKSEYKKWKERNENHQFKEYCQVGIYFMRKYLKRKL